MKQPLAELIVTEYIGREGVTLLYEAEKDMLTRRYSPYFLRRLTGQIPVRDPDLRSPREKLAVIRAVVRDCELDTEPVPIGEGGIAAALWRLCDERACGMEVSVSAIPVRQETIEVCECFGLDPYELMSGDEVCLIPAQQGDFLIRRLREQRVHAICIGSLESGADRILRQGEAVRYLNRPREDAWIQYQKGKEVQSCRKCAK